MSTVNFSVPEDVKESFNRTFEGHNKSAIIADLMRKAVAEAEAQARRKEIFRILTERRSERPSVTEEEIRAAREEGRE
jgi:metal-responsive CopG/Arc/MetJ family transcriptional regulator